MVLEDVWEEMDDRVKRAFLSVARETDRLETSRLLGALAGFADVDPAAEVINDIQESSGVELVRPGSLVESAGEPPQGVTLSPCVRETLQFFNMHGIDNINTAKLATRLLQLGHGDTVMALDRRGELDNYLEKLRTLQDG